MSWEQRNADFCNAQTDAQMAYIEAEREVDRLQTENAKLQERIHELEMEGSDHFYRTAYAEDANRTLEAENAKLRELVQKMMRFFEDGDYCTTCEKAAECDAQEEYEEDCLMRGVFHDRMRELGIEVG